MPEHLLMNRATIVMVTQTAAGAAPVDYRQHYTYHYSILLCKCYAFVVIRGPCLPMSFTREFHVKFMNDFGGKWLALHG